MQSYLQQYGYSITSGGIVLSSRYADGDNNNYKVCSDLVNNISIDFTPFSQIKFTLNPDFSSGNDGVGCRGNLAFLSTTKMPIGTKSNVFWVGYHETAVCTIDVSDINQHAFFRTYIRSASDVGSENASSTVTISKIEFVV